ncbi:uncharacterized protein LOC122757238 [Drosophila mojavensis]|uniref:CHK kinase-like domain-containing protein n=1 Tax=Drosophila mojavensis TaxID=7230 RepID=B4KFY3_DROMO|nr:uncharacterized protein LOC122757238 [Drosophila mojavensis]EDW12109.1 uncharacterized protein Dmoj_GI17509 [Drosophila mojavensis]
MSDATDKLPLYLTPQFFRRSLEHGLQQQDLKVLDVKLTDLTRGGENYCSNIYRANVKYQTAERKQLECSLIVKCMPAEKQAILARLHIYNKETVFYLHIKPKLEALMWRSNANEETWTLGARHYYSTTQPEQTIIFEDLCCEGYQLKCRQLGLDVEHAKLVMRKLAEYHALTMIMAEHEPETVIDRYPFGLLHMDAIKSEPFKLLFGTQLLKLAALISDCEGFGSITRKLYRYHEHFTERVLKSVYPLRGVFNVLNHGDLWINNIFFKYDEHCKVQQVRLIDFQLCFYGSLGFDVNYFLNTSLELDVLRTKRQQLIDTYFDALLDCLKQLPWHKPLPKYEDIMAEIREREAYGFFVAFGFFPLMSMIGIDSEDNSLKNFHDEEFARQKVQLMFEGNSRTLESLKFMLKRLDDLHVFD